MDDIQAWQTGYDILPNVNIASGMPHSILAIPSSKQNHILPNILEKIIWNLIRSL